MKFLHSTVLTFDGAQPFERDGKLLAQALTLAQLSFMKVGAGRQREAT